MEALVSPFLHNSLTLSSSPHQTRREKKPSKFNYISCVLMRDPWTVADGDISKPKPRSKNAKNPLSDTQARGIINSRARYLAALRKVKGPHVRTPGWIKRSPEQMMQYLQDDSGGYLYERRLIAAIRNVKLLCKRARGSYDIRKVLRPYEGKFSFRDMCTVLKEQKGWRPAKDFFGWMKLQSSYRHSVIIFTILLRIYGQVGMMKLAEKTFVEMLQAGCEPDEAACGTMLCTYAKWGYHKAMMSFYSSMIQKGFVPPISVYNFMLSSFQKRQHHSKAIQLWLEIVAKQVAPNFITYRIVIESYIKEGLLDEALHVFDQMANSEIVPEEVTYSHLIGRCCKNNDGDKAVALYKDMKSRAIVPSKFTCASLLTLHYRNADYAKAASLFTDMEKSKITVDEVIYGLLIKIYGKLGLCDDAEETFEEIKKRRLLTDEKTFIAMTKIYLKSCNFEKALDVIELMRSYDIPFSKFSYKILLQCYVMKGDLDSAEANFEALKGIRALDTGSYKLMLGLYGRLGLTDTCKSFIRQMRKDGVEFDEVLYRKVLKLCIEYGMLHEVEELTKEMVGVESFSCDKFILTCCLVVCGQSDHLVVGNDMKSVDQFDIIALRKLHNLYMFNSEVGKAQKVLRLLAETPHGLSIARQLIKKYVGGVTLQP